MTRRSIEQIVGAFRRAYEESLEAWYSRTKLLIGEEHTKAGKLEMTRDAVVDICTSAVKLANLSHAEKLAVIVDYYVQREGWSKEAAVRHLRSRHNIGGGAAVFDDYVMAVNAHFVTIVKMSAAVSEAHFRARLRHWAPEVLPDQPGGFRSRLS